MRTFWITPLLAGCLWLGASPGWAGVAVPLELRMDQMWINWGSQRGVPISTVAGNPPGSDGRMPNSNDSGGAGLPRTNQFQFSSFMALGGVAAATNQAVLKNSTVLNGANAFSANVATNMQLPVGRSNDVVVIALRRASIGAPYLSRQVSFAFGSIVTVPTTDERGILLTNIAKEAYWKPEPYTTNLHQNADYYWSKHAAAVFASQPGPLTVTWRKAAAYYTANLPAYTNLGGGLSFETNGANIFLLYTMRYVVSGSPVKTPRKMYWTEGTFRSWGKPVSVPITSVPGGVTIVYNRNFPAEVQSIYMAEVLSDDPNFNITNAYRTFYYNPSDKYLHAYNAEGRVFMELLGDHVSGEVYQHLGFEIVDILKQPAPLDVTTELGEQVLPPPPGSAASLTADPVATSGVTFAFKHSVAGTDRFNYYAARETVNDNDCLMHWLETGVAGLQWPLLFGRYHFIWPEDIAKYSPYVRPLAATENEARQTAVVLSTENVPIIEYQDPCDHPRAKLTEEFKFYTFLDAQYPIHRTLLRFNSGEYVGFERVLSVLNTELMSPNVTNTWWSRSAALDLDGVSQSGALPPGAYFTGGSFTIEAWVYLREHKFWQRLMNFSNDDDKNLLILTTDSDNGCPMLLTSQGTNSSRRLTTTTALPLNQWVHLAAVCDAGTSNGVIYLNGQEIGSGPLWVPENVVTTNNYLGRAPFDGRHFNGKIDNFRIWSMALTQSQIADAMRRVYPSGTGGLLAQYTFGGDTGVSGTLISLDSSGNGRDLTAVEADLSASVTQRPRWVATTVSVGDRIAAPALEPGGDPASAYLAGYIQQAAGTVFDVNAYIDPFVNGFAAANRGAVIPINAIPGANTLEVWWFRTNRASAGLNAGNTVKGFVPIYWPAVVGRYTIQWPALPQEIVLASKLGSGTLDPLVAAGSIYYQNNRSLPGYNPNEEHAVMVGGTAYATRDDLNLTNANNFSSLPFVLVEFQAADGRPAIAPFKVLREKPEAGQVFDYVVPAGQLLQPPPPLTFLAKPVRGSGSTAINYNREPEHSGGDLPGAWDDARDVNGIYGHYAQFTYRDRRQDFWVYRGPHAGLPELKAGTYVATNNSFVAAGSATAIKDSPFSFTLHVSRQDEYLSMTALNLPEWLSVNGLSLQGTPTNTSNVTNLIDLVVADLYDQSRVTNRLVLEVNTNGTAVSQAPLLISCTNAYTGAVVVYSNRPSFLALSPNSSNSFTMRYYYKTEPGFAWPDLVNPPAVGSIVPYLRQYDSTNGVFLGGDGTSTDTTPLDIVFRPFWPERDPKNSAQSLPSMPFGATLAKPAFGLPGVRDMKTARVLYQQAIARNITNATPSVVLHDPTRAKYSDLQAQNLAQLPAGVRTDYYQGLYYFPDLPPHLSQRLFFDPNRGSKGSLVLEGSFVDEALGESYVLLNVLRGSDLASAKALCPAADTDFSKWTALVNKLASSVETFYENPQQPGSYIPNPSLTVSAAVSNLVEVASDNTAVDSYALSATGPGDGYITLVEAGGTAFTQPGDPVSLHIFRVKRELYVGELKVITAPNPLNEQVTFQHTADLAGRSSEFEYEWKIAPPVNGGQPVVTDPDTMAPYLGLTNNLNVPRCTLGGAGIQALCDNYVVMRYRPMNPAHPLYTNWSGWTDPVLAEGWIKRVLAGINPFNQRVTDLFNNQVNTDASILTQAGHRWEGDVALNSDTLDNYGLIEIYETVLRRGRMLSIEAGYNYGPANDALLLAAGYLNDLYLMIGNEAWADAANPTIGIGTKDQTYGDIATALFAFKGQIASLLEEELALLRGRDDFLQPGVEVAPVYNRLVWNYTRGIDSGEVIYALNYNIQEDPNTDPDGVINATDAALMFPQGHGDAYGHYLTALKGYYSLLLNSCFDWVPRTEAVNVLGKAVSVDYQDERKFAAAAVALGRAGRQVFDLTWRQNYQPVRDSGWSHFGATRSNATRTVTSTRNWGLDHWASRAGQGLYLNWVVGNAILPDHDTNSAHEGIQKIDRTTMPELNELAQLAEDQQTALENAEGGLSPLGLPEDSLAFDLNPSAVAGTENGTHFEQIYSRATAALNNAVASFDDAKDVTRLMRSEQDSLAEFQANIANQELAYKNALIELYGTPYPDDMGPGKLYKQSYDGPDLIHYSYVEIPESTFNGMLPRAQSQTNKIDIQTLPETWSDSLFGSGGELAAALNFVVRQDDGSYAAKTNYIEFVLGSHGFFGKPQAWTGQRQSPGKIQQAISDVIKAHDRLSQSLSDAEGAKSGLDQAIKLFKADVATHDDIRDYEYQKAAAEQTLKAAEFATKIYDWVDGHTKRNIENLTKAAVTAIPQSLIVGLAAGGDVSSAARAAIEKLGYTVVEVMDWAKLLKFIATEALGFSTDTAARWIDFDKIAPLEWQQELRGQVADLGDQLSELSGYLVTINQRLRELEDAQRNYRAMVAQGDRLLQERATYRQHAAAVVQGFRTRDAAFRLFRNEKLERYKTLFDLAARYALLAANAYDYETGLLSTSEGRAFVQRIINSRALGVVRGGVPQYAGSDTGDPGLSSALAEMKADWDVLRGRLGFNNPDAYGTTVSLRTECLRILPGSDGDTNWKDMLQRGLKDNLLEDADVRRYCMQIDTANGLAVPGIVLNFSTTIADGVNLFGQQLAAGDHAFSPSAFATKIFAVGVALDGYRGMDGPAANSGTVSGTGGTSPADPTLWYLDPLALSATPYVYLLPVGVDSMRVPPLGDTSDIRTWTVNDVAIPLPFNIGASDFSTKQLWQSSDSLTETLFAVRKHQAFRPVPSASYFSQNLYTGSGTLQRSQYTNNRLVGRSVWNSQWKLVIPGKTLLSDPNEGLDRFIRTVKDVKLHFVTYSYSGN